MLWFTKNLKLIAIALIVAALIGERWRYGSQRYDEGRADEKSDYSASVATAKTDADAKEDQQSSTTRTIDTDIATDRQELNSANGRIRDLEKKLRAALRVESSRVCVESNPGSSVPETAGPSRERDDSTGGQGPSTGAERDIARDLADYARRCETDRLTVLSWQRWAEAMKGNETAQ